MEYVPLEETYALFQQWVKFGGLLSHQIDFSSHTLARERNGHWVYSRKTWRFLEGTRPYRLNRQPHSVHISQLEQHGFKVVYDLRIRDESGIWRNELDPAFRHVMDEDLATRAALIQAVKAYERGGVAQGHPKERGCSFRPSA